MFLPSDVKMYVSGNNVARFNTKELLGECVLLDGRSAEELIKEINNNIRLRFLYLPLKEDTVEYMKDTIANNLNEMESKNIIRRRNH